MNNAPVIFCILCIALGAIFFIYRIFRYPKRVREIDSFLFPLVIPGTFLDKILYLGSVAGLAIGGTFLLITEIQG